MSRRKPPQGAESTQLAAKNSDAGFPWMVKGTVSQKSSGSCNVLVVVPHSYPKIDLNTEQLGAYLATALDSYALINNHKYRAPNTRKKESSLSKPKIIDLNDSDVWESEDDYMPPMLHLIREINRTSHAKALLLFINGMEDRLTADTQTTKPDVVICIGFSANYSYVGKIESTAQSFMDELSNRIANEKMIVVQDNLKRNSDQKFPAYVLSNRTSWKIKLEAVELKFRLKGCRDTDINIRNTAEKLAKAIEGLSSFKSWREEEMVRKSDVVSKSTVELKTEEESVGRPQSQPEPGGEMVTLQEPPQPSSPDRLPDYASKVQLISPEKFQMQIDSLRASTTIKNDDGDEVSFEGEAKEEFIRLYREGYPLVERAMKSIHETGRFLFDVRRALKPKKLFLTWMSFTGLQERNSYRYLKIYERYGDHLFEFAHLGMRKLSAAAQLKNCVEYLEEHVEDAEKQTVQQFEDTIRKLKANKPKTGRGRRPSYEEVAGYKVRRTGDGTKITIEGLSQKRQEELFEAIKKLLLQDKGRT